MRFAPKTGTTIAGARGQVGRAVVRHRRRAAPPRGSPTGTVTFRFGGDGCSALALAVGDVWPGPDARPRGHRSGLATPSLVNTMPARFDHDHRNATEIIHTVPARRAPVAAVS